MWEENRLHNCAKLNHMSNNKDFITIKRVPPTASSKRRYPIEVIVKAAKQVQEAIEKQEREERKYGRVIFT